MAQNSHRGLALLFPMADGQGEVREPGPDGREVGQQGSAHPECTCQLLQPPCLFPLSLCCPLWNRAALPFVTMAVAPTGGAGPHPQLEQKATSLLLSKQRVNRVSGYLG